VSELPEVMVLAGTRPEGIKLAPLVSQLRRDLDARIVLVDSGQQPGRVGEALAPFGLTCDVELELTRSTGSLPELAAALTTQTDRVLIRHRPAAVVVQGDTLTAFIGALVAFWHRRRVVHLEAGLRTHDLGQPFPEEANRAMLARFASLHLAPTATAQAHLIAEGVPADRIVLTGNTVVDALYQLLDSGRADPPLWIDQRRRVLLATAHRRENWGDGLVGICGALRRIAAAYPDLQVVMVAHPNPAVAAMLSSLLDSARGVRITPPLPYPRLVGLLAMASLVVTDSGGLQEEAASLGVPLLVTRDTTERPEALAGGTGRLVGTDPDVIVAAAHEALGRIRPPWRESPFGDGRAARRGSDAIARLLGAAARPLAGVGSAVSG
jgi:UDP-N-acetylglucosamine 2-epimerase (non-hydrolysing)